MREIKTLRAQATGKTEKTANQRTQKGEEKKNDSDGGIEKSTKQAPMHGSLEISDSVCYPTFHISGHLQEFRAKRDRKEVVDPRKGARFELIIYCILGGIAIRCFD